MDGIDSGRGRRSPCLFYTDGRSCYRLLTTCTPSEEGGPDEPGGEVASPENFTSSCMTPFELRHSIRQGVNRWTVFPGDEEPPTVPCERRALQIPLTALHGPAVTSSATLFKSDIKFLPRCQE